MAPLLKPVRRRSNKTQPPQAEARPARSVPRPDMAATSAGSAAHESYSSDAIGTSPYDDRMLNSGWNPGMGGRSYAGVHRDYSMGGATGYNMGMGGMGGMMASGMGGGMGGGGMGGGGMGGGSGTMGMGNMAGGMLGMVNTGGGMGNMGGDFGGIAGGMHGDFGSLGGDFRGIGSGFGAGTGWANNGAGTGGGWDNEFDFEKGIGRNEVDEVSEGEEERRAERSLHGIDVHAQLQQFDGLDDEEIINDPEADLDGDGEFEGDGDQTQTLPPAASAGYCYSTAIPQQSPSSAASTYFSSAAPSGAQSRVPSAVQSHHSSIGPSRIPSSSQSIVPSTTHQTHLGLHPGHQDDLEPDANGRRSKRYTNKPYAKESVNPKLQAFYKGSDIRLIKIALSHMYLHMSLEQPFPRNSNKALFNGFIQQAIHALAAEDVAVSQDTMRNNLDDIAILLYKSTSAWRKSLKNIAANVVKARYDLPLGEHEIPDGPGHSSQDILDLGARKVDNLLKDDEFARDGTDDQGKANNYTHPAFRDIILSFFYSDSENGLAKNFPNHFKDKVPDNVLALVITVVKHCITEYKFGKHDRLSFTTQEHSRTYGAVLGGLAQIRGDAHHSAKLTTALRSWATQGCSLAGIQTDTPGSEGSATATVILD
ncbi:hypothetical protein BT96DRAFT_1007673 [Gymnopus androsaceus JB14]|uniref:DUF6532 domain-containing protein n=1 Tax=Gymnopus androsaceus JB14 TaxID=1447944 RepID=A0A6A4GHI1_9AGAR|nr:hypothetical protein BT96DRAFT_1007673 [Gymnopus androsaceus JB14]